MALQPDGKILVGMVKDVSGETNIIRLLADGTVENSGTFAAGSGPNDDVFRITVQPDGKILIGGSFTAVDAQPRNRIARLNADGSLESVATFNPGAGVVGPSVKDIAVQPDGKILVVGSFTSVNGQSRRNVARLLADGTLESTETFSAGTGSGDVSSVALQPDGKILIGGAFGTVNGQPRYQIARLLSNGSLDTSFNPDLEQISTVNSVAVQADGKILVGGSFFSGIPIAVNRGLARLTAGGSREGYYLPLKPKASGENEGSVNHILIQADRKILVAGRFVSMTGQRDLVRLNPAATVVERAFSTPGYISSIIQQGDGKIIVAGFSNTGNGLRPYVARLNNDPATQVLTIVGGAKVQWLRSDSAPEIDQVTWERSTNDGATWTPLGLGTRIAGGWELAGQSLPDNAAIRARGRPIGSGHSSLVEQTLNVPEIAVKDATGLELVDGSARITNYGTVVSGSSGSKQFTIRNPGTVNLSGLAVTLAGANPGDFTVAPFGATAIDPGSEVTFTVNFSPSAAGTRTATLQILSNDPDENPFKINLTGTQATPSEAWRQTYFGSPYNTGAAQDLSDPDGDGVVNILEYATATDPLHSTPFPGTLVKNGNTLEFSYTRRKTAVGEMSFLREFSETLTGTWSTVGGTVETILSDGGVLQQVKTTVPAGIEWKALCAAASNTFINAAGNGKERRAFSRRFLCVRIALLF